MIASTAWKVSTSALIFCGSITGCSSQPKTDPDTLVNVCKSVVAAITTSNSHKSMSGRFSDGMSNVEYARDDDGKVFKSQCKFYPTSDRTGAVVWRGVDVWEPGGGPGIWREREYDEIVEYLSTVGENGKETITLQIIYTGASRTPTGRKRFEEFVF